MTRKDLIFIIGIALIILTTSLGYLSDPEYHRLTRLETYSEVYWEATYSELYCGTDYEGNTNCDYEYWDETISDVYFLGTVYSDLGFFYTKSYPEKPSKENVFYPPTPDKYKYSREDLDDINLRKNISVRCWYEVDSLYEDYNSVSFKDYNKYREKIGEIVEVKTWYGIRRSLK